MTKSKSEEQHGWERVTCDTAAATAHYKRGGKPTRKAAINYGSSTHSKSRNQNNVTGGDSSTPIPHTQYSLAATAVSQAAITARSGARFTATSARNPTWLQALPPSQLVVDIRHWSCICMQAAILRPSATLHACRHQGYTHYGLQIQHLQQRCEQPQALRHALQVPVSSRKCPKPPTHTIFYSVTR